MFNAQAIYNHVDNLQNLINPQEWHSFKVWKKQNWVYVGNLGFINNLVTFSKLFSIKMVKGQLLEIMMVIISVKKNKHTTNLIPYYLVGLIFYW